MGRIVQYFDRKRVTSSVWNDYELKLRGCEQYGITRRNGFLYLDSCQKIQFRVPGDLSRSMEQISPEELAAGMLAILRQEGVTDKKIYIARWHYNVVCIDWEKKSAEFWITPCV